MMRAILIAENYKNRQSMIKENNYQNTTNTGMDYIPCYVAALYVQPNGCYAGEAGIDAWDEKRDARKYTGNLPVIAHPPCQLWGALAFVNYKRWGGKHNKPENDGGCFESALANVNRCGGVLEHPAKTRAFKKYGLEKPKGIGWQKSGDGWVCEVWQSAYGHRANKATWLYYKGKNPPYELKWGRVKGTHQVGQQCRQGIRKDEPWRNKPSLGKKEANATPIEFRDELIKLALYSAAT
jgi:hypothetical protein